MYQTIYQGLHNCNSLLVQIFSNVFIILTKSKIVRIRKLFLYSFFIHKEIEMTIEKYILSYYIEFIMEAEIKLSFLLDYNYP